MGKENTPALLEKYSVTKDVNTRNEIVLLHMDIVKYVAISLRNIYAKYADLDDIVNEGVIALMGAIDTFDATKGVKFETYANIKVRGAIIDFVRKQDWVPRQVRKFSKELNEAFCQLNNQLERTPTNAEIAEYMDISEEKLAKGMADVAGAITLSFEELLYEDNFEYLEQAGDNAVEKRMYQQELKATIADAISQLKDKEKQVVNMYYYEKMKFADIATVLGVTQSRVCQIHSKAMLVLKTKLEAYVIK